MAGPVYKWWRAGAKEAWYQLSKEEQDAMFAKVDEARKSVGAKVLIYCSSGWDSEKWSYWGVEEFPSIEAVQEFARCIEDLNWLRYIESDIMLGTALPTTNA
jgi:hypothetical protein